jgi:K+-transporting ATPase ATPase A chain
MTFTGWLTVFLFVTVLTALAMPLGRYMAAVYSGERTFLDPLFLTPERLFYRIMRVDPKHGQDWTQYAKSLIIFSLAGWLLLYFILRTQTLWSFTGLNPQGFHSAPWNVTFNTTSSFVTNTNWQYYGGETTMSYFSQMAGLTVQNFLSAGVGIAVAVALIRGIIGRSGNSLGNFWFDLIRTVLWVLTPISFVVALVLVFQGSIQNFAPYASFSGPTGLANTIAMGPVASQEAIKLLGTNGGGFFNTNSAHPFENPTGFTNFLEMTTVLILPAALVFMYGRMAGNRRQGYAIYATMMVMFLGAACVAYIAEAHGSPAQHAAGLHTQVIAGSTGGNMEGKEQRFGIAGSALFDVVTTVTSCGAVNSSIESFTGIGGAVPFANLSASEVIFGGVGTGLYSILLYVLLAVFIGGLMVGRTPTFAGYTGYIQPTAGNLGAHGITFADLTGGVTMLFARYAPILFALAVAGALAGKRVSPAGLGTMRTDNPTFVILLIGVIVLVGALTFFPALLLGPIVQGLTTHLY